MGRMYLEELTMKKYFTRIIIFTFLFVSLSLVVGNAQQSPNKIKNNFTSNEIFMFGDYPNLKVNNTDEAFTALSSFNESLGVSNVKEYLKYIEETEQFDGTKTIRFQQVFDNIPVYGEMLVLHITKNLKVSGLTGYFDKSIFFSKKFINPQFTEKMAFDISLKLFQNESNTNIEIIKKEKVLYKSEQNVFELAYNFIIINPKTMEKWNVVVSAISGKVLESYIINQKVQKEFSGTGVDNKVYRFEGEFVDEKYYLKDELKNIEIYDATDIGFLNMDKLPGKIIDDNEGLFDNEIQKAGVSAFVNIEKSYDYFLKNFNRKSFDGNGSKIIASVHFGYNYDNAMWNGKQLIIGDGDNEVFKPLSGSLDIVGHEMTHAIIDYTARLFYVNQSGALAESFADVFGNLIEDKPDNEWLLGEDVYTPGIEGDALRSMSNPQRFNMPDTMEKYMYTDVDNGGVHINSSIPSKAFYNVVQSLSRADAAKIWYKVMTQYLAPKSDFSYAKKSSMAAAGELFGIGSKEYQAVKKAWDDVGVMDPVDTGIAPDKFEPNETFEGAYGPIRDSIIYNGKISNSNDMDIYKYISDDNGMFSVKLAAPIDCSLILFDDSGKLLSYSDQNNSFEEEVSYKGAKNKSYYIIVTASKYDYSKYEYFMSVLPESDYKDDLSEPNDTLDSAYNMGVLSDQLLYSGKFSHKNDTDWVKFTNKEDWRNVTVKLDYEFDIQIYDTAGIEPCIISKNQNITIFSAAPNTDYVIRITGEKYAINFSYTVSITSEKTLGLVASYPRNGCIDFPFEDPQILLFNEDIELVNKDLPDLNKKLQVDEYRRLKMTYFPYEFIKDSLLCITSTSTKSAGKKTIKIPPNALRGKKSNLTNKHEIIINFSTESLPIVFTKKPDFATTSKLNLSGYVKEDCSLLFYTSNGPTIKEFILKKDQSFDLDVEIIPDKLNFLELFYHIILERKGTVNEKVILYQQMSIPYIGDYTPYYNINVPKTSDNSALLTLVQVGFNDNSNIPHGDVNAYAEYIVNGKKLSGSYLNSDETQRKYIDLNDGINNIDIIITDSLGNKTTHNYKVEKINKFQRLTINDFPTTVNTKNLLISGTVEPDNKIYVNGISAVVNTNKYTSSKYSMTTILKEGKNEIEVQAVNLAGSVYEKKIIVTYDTKNINKKNLKAVKLTGKPSVFADEAVRSFKLLYMADDNVLKDFNKQIKRQEFAFLAVKFYETLTQKIMKKPETYSFSDITGIKYKDYVQLAKNLGIMDGTQGKFNPDMYIQKQEMCSMLVNLLKSLNPKLIKDVKDDLKFSDKALLAEAYRKSLVFSYKNGFLDGIVSTKSTKLDPTQRFTREQAFKVLMNMALKYGYIKIK